MPLATIACTAGTSQLSWSRKWNESVDSAPAEQTATVLQLIATAQGLQQSGCPLRTLPLGLKAPHTSSAGMAAQRYETLHYLHFLAQGLGKVGLSQPFPAKHAKLFPRNGNLPAAIHVQLLANSRKRHGSGHRLLSLNRTIRGQREPLLAPFCQSPQQNSCIFCTHTL